MLEYLETSINESVSGLDGVNAIELIEKVKSVYTSHITRDELDALVSETAISMVTKHYNYNIVATRVSINNLHTNISKSFSQTMELLYGIGLMNINFMNVVRNNRELLDGYVNRDRDYLFDYFGYKTLERGYLQKIGGKIIEIPQYIFMRVAVAIHLDNLENALQMYDDLSNKYYIHATPTLFNAGLKFSQLSSCYLVAMKDDSIEGIYETLKECAQISKWAGGIGVHIHQIRGKNSKIRGNNGTSDGIVPMLKVFNDTAKYCNQAGKRPGSIAVYIEPWHNDIEAFLDLKKNHGNEDERARDLFYALWIPDLFMKRVKENGDWYLMCPDESRGLSEVHSEEFDALYNSYVSSGKYRKKMPARDLWTKILHSQVETGVPYMLYKDSANKKSNQGHLGTIKSSNLCVAPETKILTDNGHIEIKNLVNRKVNVWNGEEFSEVTIKKTGENQELIDVYTDDGCVLTCTKYHKFYIQNSYNKKIVSTIEAQTLKTGDKLMKCDYPIIDGTQQMAHPYTHGFFCGDGTYGNITGREPIKCMFKSLEGHLFCKRHIDFETDFNTEKNIRECVNDGICNRISYSKKPKAYLYGDKKKLLEYLVYRTKTEVNDRINLELPLDLEEKYFVPMNHTLKTKLDWFAGYCDADGCIARNGSNESLQISSITRDFLQDVKLMLQTCGINPKIKLMKEAGISNLPNGKNGRKDFNTQPVYRLLITSYDLKKLIDIGFIPKRLTILPDTIPDRSAAQYVKILKVVNNNRIDDTYCFTEPKKHAGIFNGIITSQCTEIIQYSAPDETAVCNLASIGLPMYINSDKTFNHALLGEKVRHIVRNLNNVIDINFYPTENAKRSNMKHRPIGIGIQGLADVFMELGLDWETDTARALNIDIFETIYYYALLESCNLAKEKGTYESYNGSPASKGQLQFDLWSASSFIRTSQYDWHALKMEISKYGLRNSLLVAPMPTASTSQILGFTECIEPITSNIYTRTTLAGSYVVVNKRLMKDCMDLGIWTEHLKNEIIRNDGSVQGLSIIPKVLQDKYKTVWEIKQKTLIDMSADRGRYICQSQSLNLYLSKIDMNRLGSMHLYAWKQGLKTGLYYLRIKPVTKTQQFTVEPIKVVTKEAAEAPVLVCRREAGCVTCSS